MNYMILVVVALYIAVIVLIVREAREEAIEQADDQPSMHKSNINKKIK